IRSLEENGGAGGIPSAGASPQSGAPAPARPSGAFGSSRTSAALASRPEPVAAASPVAANAPAPMALSRFEDVIALAAARRDLQIKTALERDVRLVSFEDGRLEIALEPGAARTLVNDLQRKLSSWTGRLWMVAVSRDEGAPTLKAQAAVREAELKHGVRADPVVQAVLDRFPGAEIVAVRGREQDMPMPDFSTDDSGGDPDSDEERS
ncbi:MAG: DNA polymerase III subunit gamma/tau, partial [Pseudorhodoplanes sp.]